MRRALAGGFNASSTVSSTRYQPTAATIASMTAPRLLDVELRCTWCGDHFVYSAGEQELRVLRGVAHEPRVCPTCRKRLGRS